MKTSLDHLSPRKQREIAWMVDVLRRGGPVEMIILFGSHARGDQVEDRETGYRSDYDILVVTQSRTAAEDLARWGAATEAITSPDRAIDLLVHDFKFVERQIQHGQYFFCDIVKEGILLYTSGAFTLTADRAPTPAQRRAQAERDFARCFTSAREFYDDYEGNLAKGRHNKAAFELHQAAERYLAAFHLVFTAYVPRTHNLERLLNGAAHHHPDLAAHIPRTTPEDRRLFDLLKKAYVDARYSSKYAISADDLRALGARVRDLADVIDRVCREKIAGLA